MDTYRKVNLTMKLQKDVPMESIFLAYVKESRKTKTISKSLSFLAKDCKIDCFY